MGLFPSSKEFLLATCKYGKLQTSLVKQKKENSYREEGAPGRGFCEQKVHGKKLRLWNTVAFIDWSVLVSHWLSCCQAKRKNFLLLAVVMSLPMGDASKVPSLPSGICIDSEWELPLWPLDSILVRSPFIYLHSPKSHTVSSRTGIQSQFSTFIFTIILLRYSWLSMLC